MSQKAPPLRTISTIKSNPKERLTLAAGVAVAMTPCSARFPWSQGIFKEFSEFGASATAGDVNLWRALELLFEIP